MFKSISKSLSQYADFKGRATRSEFWYFVLFMYLASFFGGLVDGFAKTEVFGSLVFFSLVIPYIAVAVRRMHDAGKNGWFMLIPFYNFVLTLTSSVPADENTESE